jgi:hypothetical protein
MGKLLKDRKITSILLIYLLLLPSYGQTDNSWDNVRYNGGTLSTEVSFEDWGNHLSVTSEEVRLLLKDGKTISIKPSSITGLRYGQEAHRRVGVGLFHKTKLHYIAIEYNLDGGKKAGVLLQGHKDNYRDILLALKSVSGKEIEMGANERQELAPHSEPKGSTKAEAPHPKTSSEPERTSEAAFPKRDTATRTQNPQSTQERTYVECKDSMKSIAVASSATMKEIQCGQEITILTQDRNWTRLRTLDGKEGYVPTKFIVKK